MAWKVLFLCNLALFVFISFEEAIADDEPQFTALFVFGDSLMDLGNNNYLANSLAKANYVPYGVDFQGPTGRFCNGRAIIDYLGDLLGLPLIPAYTVTITLGHDISKGVNYASAAAGIHDETGQSLALHPLGLRKFLLGGIGPLGCIPSQLGTGIAPPGKCVSVVNEMIGMFNSQLKALVDKLNKDNHDSIFVYDNTF